MDDKTMLECAARAAGIVAIVSLAGCSEPGKLLEPTMQEKAERMDCSVEQYAQVINQAEWCNKNTGYLSAYCYDRATVNLCSEPAAAEIGKAMGRG
jgi:hypothetical protein